MTHPLATVQIVPGLPIMWQGRKISLLDEQTMCFVELRDIQTGETFTLQACTFEEDARDTRCWSDLGDWEMLPEWKDSDSVFDSEPGSDSWPGWATQVDPEAPTPPVLTRFCATDSWDFDGRPVEMIRRVFNRVGFFHITETGRVERIRLDDEPEMVGQGHPKCIGKTVYGDGKPF